MKNYIIIFYLYIILIFTCQVNGADMTVNMVNNDMMAISSEEKHRLNSYEPPYLSQNSLGSILELLYKGEKIDQSFEKGKIIIKLPDGQIYIDGDMDIDSDGSPRAKEIDDYGQYETSLNYTDRIDEEKYVNSEEIPYFVLPSGFAEKFSIKLGDIGAVIYKGQVEYAIFADTGPADKIGEGSIKLASLFGHNPFKDGKVKIGIDENVIYIVFPSSGDQKFHSPEEIKEKGEKLFENLQSSEPTPLPAQLQ